MSTGSYIYSEVYGGETGTLMSPRFTRYETTCLEFYFYQWTSIYRGSGSLGVIDRLQATSGILWQSIDRLPGKWHLGQVTLSQGPHQIVFTNYMRMALDDIRVIPGACVTSGNVLVISSQGVVLEGKMCHKLIEIINNIINIYNINNNFLLFRHHIACVIITCTLILITHLFLIHVIQ